MSAVSLRLLGSGHPILVFPLPSFLKSALLDQTLSSGSPPGQLRVIMACFFFAALAVNPWWFCWSGEQEPIARLQLFGSPCLWLDLQMGVHSSSWTASERRSKSATKLLQAR